MALDECVRELPVGGHEFASVPLERILVGAVRAQRLPHEDEIGNAADQVFDGRTLRMEACGSRLPQRGAHAASVIGPHQEIIKRRKNFSKLSLS